MKIKPEIAVSIGILILFTAILLLVEKAFRMDTMDPQTMEQKLRHDHD